VSNIKTICLFGGDGTRLQPLTLYTNKSLLRLGGLPVCSIIAYKLLASEHLLPEDITVTCHKKHLVDYEWEFRDLKGVEFAPMEGTYGTATYFYFGILNTIRNHYGIDRHIPDNEFYQIASQEGFEWFIQKYPSVMVQYGDTITKLNYEEMFKSWDNRPDPEQSTAMLAVTQNIRHDYSEVHLGQRIVMSQVPDETFDLEYLAALNQMRVDKMIEKPKLSYPSWTGIAIFNTRRIIDILSNKITWENNTPTYVDFGYDILPILTQNQELIAYQYNGQWFDVGNMASYNKLYQQFLETGMKILFEPNELQTINDLMEKPAFLMALDR
jgi:NDP-sugar pyrophosphorylase family protein